MANILSRLFCCKKSICSIIKLCGSDRTRLIDMLLTVLTEYGFISDKAINTIACKLGLSAVEVRGVVSFYHFFSRQPVGKYAVYVEGPAEGPKGKRQTKKHRQTGWPTIDKVGKEEWDKAVPDIERALQR